jgi:hypothetical protein
VQPKVVYGKTRWRCIDAGWRLRPQARQHVIQVIAAIRQPRHIQFQASQIDRFDDRRKTHEAADVRIDHGQGQAQQGPVGRCRAGDGQALDGHCQRQGIEPKRVDAHLAAQCCTALLLGQAPQPKRQNKPGQEQQQHNAGEGPQERAAAARQHWNLHAAEPRNGE